MRPLLPALLLITSACSRPPEAPAELDELCAYLFAHMDDDDTAALDAGVDNLAIWLADNLDDTLEGYEVHDLTSEAVDDLDDRERPVDALNGAAVGYLNTFSVDELTMALVVDEQEQVFPDNYDSHERTFLSDPDCFVDHSCGQVATENRVESSYALGLQVSTHGMAEYRWSELDGEPVLIHRTWLMEPPEVNFDWISVDAQYYIGVTMPWDGGALRLGATWMAASLSSGQVPEATALNMIINSMITEGDNLEAYLEQ